MTSEANISVKHTYIPQRPQNDYIGQERGTPETTDCAVSQVKNDGRMCICEPFR